jgi:transcriptional regulator
LFVRPCWQPASGQDALDLIERNPWALLVSNGAEVPYATNLPLLLDHAAEGTELVGHIARGNEHSRALASGADGTQVLAIFEGPWSYVTASWYPNRDMPSTYYYTSVHCTGTLEMQTEAELDESLEDLTQRMESHYIGGWRTSEVPRSEIVRRFSAIAGFRIRVSRVEAKFKLGQDEPLRDALAVAGALERHSSPQDHELAALIRRHNSSRQQ